MGIALTYANVSKTYKQGSVDVYALHDVSLTIPEGQFVALVGASGSGKSTLLHLTAGLTRADSGTIHLFDQAITQMNDEGLTALRRNQIAIIFQAFNLFPTMTAIENVMFPAIMAGANVSTAETNARRWLDAVKLGHRVSHRPDALSGGEQQRVAIARALMHEGKLMLADEPTGNLDSTTGQEILQILKDLARQYQRTLVLVTHDLQVASHADRVIEMRDGKIIQDRMERAQ